ncbi:DUF4412 domain-containing protein [Pontibacter pudoricolor]|uniref:DUF4412 domain-containing protein n=1 Tax=Pontibacter pudoricolor TaxID=2694930 RepID=UPI0013913D37|nr:DUF4412 domain-containing protein [Pontibacter pudoricolor]
MKLLTIILVFLSLATLCRGQDSVYFEGKVIYTQLEKNGYGVMVPGKTLSKTEALFKNTWYKYSVLEGSPAMHRAGDIVVNTADSTRFNVNNSTYTATSLGMEPVMQGYAPKEITLVHEQDSVLGYACRKYKVIQRAFIDGVDKTSYVWTAKGLKVANYPLLAQLFGYQNTLIKNGTFDGVTLKVEVLSQDGSPELVISAVEVNPAKLDKSLFEIPKDYRLK